MDINALIPVSFAIPQEFYVFRGLELITFFLHFLFVNLLLGSSLLILFLNLTGRFRREPFFPETKKYLTGRLPIIFAFTVNLGVAPYLFLQVIYGSYIYTSSILMGFYWLSVIFTIIAAYSIIYYYRSKEEKFSKEMKIFFTLLFTILLVYTALVFAANVNLMLEPDKWSGYFRNKGGTYFDFNNPVLYGKIIHILTGSVAVTAMVAAFYSYVKRKKNPVLYEETIFGIRFFAGAAILQIISGVVLYYLLPSNVVKALPERFIYYMITAGILTFAAVLLAFKRKLMPGKILLTIIFLLMVLMKDMVRSSYLQLYFNKANLEVVKQNGPFIIFLSVFLIASVVIFFLIRKVMRDKVEIELKKS